MNISNRLINEFDYIKEELDIDLQNEEEEEKLEDVDLSSLGKRIVEKAEKKRITEEEMKIETEANTAKKKKLIGMDELISVQDFLSERHEKKDWKHERHHTGKMSSSVTSSYMDLHTKDELRDLTDMEMMINIWNEVKSFHRKAYLQLQTNLGELNVELFSDQAARTCYSILEMVYKNQLNGLRFNRLVEDTFLSIGTIPKSKGSLKLETVDMSEKLRHNKQGLLSVDTLGGVETLGITLSSDCSALDRTNSVFGAVMFNFELLLLINDAGADEGERPLKQLEISSIKVLQDPFRETCRRIRRRLSRLPEDLEVKPSTETESSKLAKGETSRKIINM